MAEEISQVNFRMPTALKERLEREAKTNERSLTAEIVYRLQETLQMDEHQPVENAHPDDAPKELSELVEMIQRSSAYMQRIERQMNRLLGVGDRFGYIKKKHYFVPRDDKDDDAKGN